MYSLLVSYQEKGSPSSAIEIKEDRFLEYTSDPIRSQLANLSTEAADCLKAWPCLLMQEGRGEEIVHLIQISTVILQMGLIKLTYSIVSGQPVLLNDALWKMRHDLDIADFEFSRNHWAVKDRDLLLILSKAGYSLNGADASRFEPRPLPAPSRQELIKARDVIESWGHSQIDDFLLEAGVTGLDASRALGGRRARANAILKFALATPQATTAENSLFTAHTVRRALKPEGHAIGQVVGNSTGQTAARTAPQQARGDNGHRGTNRVFVVHGQNELARKGVVDELQRLGLVPIVLHAQPNMGRHLLTKFIEEAELVTFAVVLMTADDVGSIKDGALAPRARQNVILELGYFLSHLGQPRVCALITPGLETPSDFDGIVYIRMDAEGNWKSELARELHAADMPINEKRV